MKSFWCRYLPMCCLAGFLAAAVGAMAQVKELPVYNEWHGKNSTFKSTRPFFLIRDLHALKDFWGKSGSDEPTPGIDFSRYMLLVWCPGASLFDYVPVRIERLVYKEGSYFVLMDFQRKDTGGYWRRPFMATMLPLAVSGDFFIMRKVMRGAHKVEWQPVYTMWDMSGKRQRPLEQASYVEPSTPIEFIAHAPDSKPERPAVSQSTPAVSPPAVSAAPVAPAAQPPAVVSGAASAKTEPEARPVQPAVSPPTPKAIDEDPLFGTEFDITF